MVSILVALGIDNLGSGLFLPLTLVYATRVVGLPLAVAGVTVAVGTVVGMLVPPVAGRLVDRVGPRPVVIASQVLQALGTLGYAVAGGVGSVAVAVCLLAPAVAGLFDVAVWVPWAIVAVCAGAGAVAFRWLVNPATAPVP